MMKQIALILFIILGLSACTVRHEAGGSPIVNFRVSKYKDEKIEVFHLSGEKKIPLMVKEKDKDRIFRAFEIILSGGAYKQRLLLGMPINSHPHYKDELLFLIDGEQILRISIKEVLRNYRDIENERIEFNSAGVLNPFT